MSFLYGVYTIAVYLVQRTCLCRSLVSTDRVISLRTKMNNYLVQRTRLCRSFVSTELVQVYRSTYEDEQPPRTLGMLDVDEYYCIM